MDIIANLVSAIADKLLAQQNKLSVAESCTGGGVAYHLTELAGSSAWFDRGFVTYSNASKSAMLGVSAATIAQHGAVSEETALAMAIGAINFSVAQVSLSITGIAGPQGGSAEKPVGTVWFGWSVKGELLAKRQIFTGNRAEIRRQAIIYSLTQLLGQL